MFVRSALLLVLLHVTDARALDECRFTAPPEPPGLTCRGVAVTRVAGAWKPGTDPLAFFAAAHPKLERTSFAFDGPLVVGTFLEQGKTAPRPVYVQGDPHAGAVHACRARSAAAADGRETCLDAFALVREALPSAPAERLFKPARLPPGCAAREDGRRGFRCEDGLEVGWHWAHELDGVPPASRRESLARVLEQRVGSRFPHTTLESLDCTVASRPALCLRVDGSAAGGEWRHHLVVGTRDLGGHALVVLLDLGASPFDPPPWLDPLLRLAPKP